MNENTRCPIWGTEASVCGDMNRPGVEVVDSPRSGGKYVIFRRARLILKNRDWRFRARLTSWLVEQRRLGVEYPEIMTQTIEEMEQRRDLTVHKRADRLLQHIEKETSLIGEHVFVPRLSEIKDGAAFYEKIAVAFAQSESIDRHEVSFLLGYLEEQGWLKKPHREMKDKFILTVEGYARLAELDNVATDSSQGFVAMWFDDSMKDTYEIGIRPGIEDAGYEARRIDRIEHINKIDDEIIAEIRRSRFVVADFTHGDTGARGGVYYEAGFAHGLNIPVIFTCREDILMDIHFDTRQYNHIAWDSGKLEEFRKELADRISAVIGDGPNKNKNNEQDS